MVRHRRKMAHRWDGGCPTGCGSPFALRQGTPQAIRASIGPVRLDGGQVGDGGSGFASRDEVNGGGGANVDGGVVGDSVSVVVDSIAVVSGGAVSGEVGGAVRGAVGVGGGGEVGSGRGAVIGSGVVGGARGAVDGRGVADSTVDHQAEPRLEDRAHLEASAGGFTAQDAPHVRHVAGRAIEEAQNPDGKKMPQIVPHSSSSMSWLLPVARAVAKDFMSRPPVMLRSKSRLGRATWHSFSQSM